MSKEIDERVVSMQFDNTLFEKNIQKSLKSVDDLNKSLNNLDGAKGFDKLNDAAKKVDLSPIMDSAKEVEKSFSKMEIVSTGALLRIGSELTDFGIKIGKKFWNATIGQIQSGGWKRAADIKSGTFMLEGLGLTDKQVKEMTQAAQDAVTDTAAGMGEAMKAAGVLATSGLKDAEKMRDTLRGIAGMSAMTGRSFENIANIYSTVASNGKLMTMQLRQFAAAGINVSAKLAERLGTTEEAINKMVTEGKIDFETFSEAMTYHFGEHAKEANKTFEGALANMKAALSRIGANFATPFMDNVKDVFNNLRVFFNAVNKALEPVYKDFQLLMQIGNKFIDDVFSKFITKDDKGNLESYSEALDNIVAGVRNLYSGLILIIKTVGEAFKEAFPPIEDGTKSFEELTKALMPTSQGLDLLKNVMIGVFKVVNVLFTVFKSLVSFGSEVVQIIFAVIHAITGLTDNGLNKLLKKIGDGIDLGEALEDVFGIVAMAIMGIGAAIVGVVKLISGFIKKLGDFFKFDFNSIKQIGMNIITGICQGLEAGFGLLQKIWGAIVNYIPDTIKNILKIKSPSRVMMGVGANVVLGITKGMDSKKEELNTEVEETGGILNKIVDFGLMIADTLGKTAYAAIEGLIGLFKKFTGKVDDANLKKTAATLVETKEVMNDVYMSGAPASGTTTQVVKMGDDWVETNENVEKSTESMSNNVTSFFDTISTKLHDLGINLDAFKLILAGFGVAMVATFTQAAFSLNLLSGLGRTIATLSIIAGAFILLKNVDFGPIIEGIKALFTNLKNFADNLHIVENIKNFFTTIRKIVEENNMIMLAAKALAFSFAIVIIRLVHNLATFALNISNSVSKISSAVASLTKIRFGLYESAADKVLKFAVAISAIVVALSILAKAFAEDPKAMKSAAITIGAIIGIVGLFTLLMSRIAKDKGKAIIATSAMKQMQTASLAILALVASTILICTEIDKYGMGYAVASLMMFAGVLVAFGVFCGILNGVEVKMSTASVIGMTVLMLAVGKMMRDFSLMLEQTSGLDNIALAFVKMVGPILAALMGIALIIKMTQQIENKTSKSQVAGGMFGLIKKVMGSDEESSSKKGISDNAAKTLLALAGVIAILGGVMKVFATFDSDKLYYAVMGMMTIISTFGAMCIIANHYQTAITGLSGFARDLAITVLALTGALRLLTDLDDTEFMYAYQRMTLIAMTISGILVVVGWLFSKIFDEVTELVIKVKGLGMTLASLAAGLAMLGAVFSFIPQDRLNQFMEWTAKLTLIIAGMAVLISVVNMVLRMVSVFTGKEFDDAKNTFTNMLGMVLAMGVLLGSLVVLSLMDPESLLAPITVITLMLLGLSLMFSQLGKIKDVSNAKSIFNAIAAIIGFLSVTLAMLTVLPIDVARMLDVAFAIDMILAGLAGLMRGVAKLNDIKIGKGVMPVLGMMSLIILSIGAVLGGLAVIINTMNNPLDFILPIIGITAVLGVLVGLFAVLGVINIDESVTRTIGFITLAIAAICGCLLLLSNFGGENLNDAMKVIVTIMSVVAAITIFGGLIGFIPGVTEALGALAVVIGVFAGAVLAVGLSVSAVLLTLSGTLGVITVCIQNLQNVNFDYVAVGLLKVAGATLAFGAAMATAVVLVGGAVTLITGMVADILVKLLPLFAVIGAFLMVGLSKGIKSEAKKAAEAAVQAANGVTDSTKDAFQEKSPSKLFRQIGQFLLDGLALGIIDKIPFVGDTIKKFVNDIATWLNGKADELEKTGDTWGNAIKLGIGDALGDVNFEIPSLTDNMQELVDTFQKETDESTDAAAATEDFASAADVASESTNNLSNNIANALDMFSGFDSTATMTGKDVIRSFNEQLNGVSKWAEELESLSARGLGQVIIQDLAEMGPQAYEKVHAFYTMTNSELAMMNIMYKQKLALQNGTSKKIAKSFGQLTDDIGDTLESGFDSMSDQLTGTVTDMGSNLMKALKKQMDYETVISQVAGFRDNVADKIRNSMSIFEAVQEDEEVKAEELLKNMKDQVKRVGKWASMITEMAAKGFDEGLVATLTEMGPQSYSKVKAFLTMNESQIAEANRLFEASEQVPEYGADKIVKAFAQAGFTASMGLTDSFLEGLDPEAVERAMGDLATTSVSTLLETLYEPTNDPLGIGETYAGLFADGLESQVDRVKEAADKVAEAGKIDMSKELIDYGYHQTDYARVMSPIVNEREALLDNKRAQVAASKQYYEKSYANYLIGEKASKELEAEKFNNNLSIILNDNDKKLDEIISKYEKYGDYYKKYGVGLFSTGKGLNTQYNIGAINKQLMPYIQEDANAGDKEAQSYINYLNNIVKMSADNVDENYVYDMTKNVAKNAAAQFGNEEVLSTAAEGGAAISVNAVNGMAGDDTKFTTTHQLQSIKRTDLKDMPIGKGLFEFGVGFGTVAAEGASTEGAEAMAEAGETVAGAFIISLRDNLVSLLQGVLGVDGDFMSPTIKPVVDTSGANKSLKELFGIGSGKNPIDLTTTSNLNMSYKDSNSKLIDAIKGNTNQDVVEAVQQLSEIVNLFRGEATSLNVVMDTGAMVGALGHPIDLYLGQQSMNSGRGMQ